MSDQRPWVAVGPGGAGAREAPRPPLGLRHAVAATGAERRPGVVRDLAGPDEVPERRQGFVGRQAGLLDHVGPEERAGPERRSQPVVLFALGRGGARNLTERGRILAEVDGDPIEPGADPDDLAARAERVELLGTVVGHPARQELGLPQSDGEREGLKRHESFAQRGSAVDPVPRGQETREGSGLDGLDLPAKRGERGAAEAAQDVGVAPFAFGAARAELAADEQLLAFESREDVAERRGRTAHRPRRS